MVGDVPIAEVKPEGPSADPALADGLPDAALPGSPVLLSE
jgi:hypothetical protein